MVSGAETTEWWGQRRLSILNLMLFLFLPSRHEALEFLEPVLDEDHLDNRMGIRFLRFRSSCAGSSLWMSWSARSAMVP